jgi:hypothetical protein
LALIILAGCSTEPEAEIVTTEIDVVADPAQNNDVGKITKSERPPLDLSMPENIWVADPEDIEQVDIPSHKFDAKPLFERKDKDDELSVTVIPSFETSDEDLTLPKLDGGSVSVEVKTK